MNLIGTASVYRVKGVAESLKLALQPVCSTYSCHQEVSTQEGLSHIMLTLEQKELA